MPSLGQKAVAALESQVGVSESGSSNCGGCQKYQALYPGWGRCGDGREGGWAWCGAAAGWALEQAKAGGKSSSDPSTATICASKGRCDPQPGALLVSCGNHVVVARYRISGTAWACVGGNESGAVRFSTRDTAAGWQAHGPAWLGVGAEPDEPPPSRWYFLQDTLAVSAAEPAQHAFYGGWATEAARDEVYADLKRKLGHEIRRFRDNAWPSPYFLDNSAFVDEIYGGWLDEDARDESREVLEARLGHSLRPYSETRTAAQGGVPWAADNLA